MAFLAACWRSPSAMLSRSMLDVSAGSSPKSASAVAEPGVFLFQIGVSVPALQIMPVGFGSVTAIPNRRALRLDIVILVNQLDGLVIADTAILEHAIHVEHCLLAVPAKDGRRGIVFQIVDAPLYIAVLVKLDFGRLIGERIVQRGASHV